MVDPGWYLHGRSLRKSRVAKQREMLANHLCSSFALWAVITWLYLAGTWQHIPLPSWHGIWAVIFMKRAACIFHPNYKPVLAWVLPVHLFACVCLTGPAHVIWTKFLCVLIFFYNFTANFLALGKCRQWSHVFQYLAFSLVRLMTVWSLGQLVLLRFQLNLCFWVVMRKD